MTESPGPDEDQREATPERTGDEGASDARNPAREQAGEDAEREGRPREGDEGAATGNPHSAGED
jgi:hypothetical protein